MEPSDLQKTVSRKNLAASSKILIVEDNPFQRIILNQVLENSGFSNIEESEDGLDALEKVINWNPDLIILDIEMPKMNGLELCQKIQKIPEIKNIPILAQSGRTKSIHKEEIFDVGASDYVSKPIDPKELIARVFTHLERARLSAQLSEFHDRVQDELATAARTHRTLFPNKELISEIQKSYGIAINNYETASSELGGDFWGIYQLSESLLALYIIDFSGHGINAALNTFRLYTLMQQQFHKNQNAGEFLTELNYNLAPTLPSGQFATMFYGIVDITEQTLNYATAGCPTSFIFRNNNNVDSISGDGFLLGALNDSRYETKQVSFCPDEMLFLYSDALIESPDKTGHIMNEEEIIKYFIKQPEEGFDRLIKKLKNNYNKNWPDDLTINAYYYKNKK
jgi:sigma-B regulation protein RsbU (phosphoserine phosphatase)